MAGSAEYVIHISVDGFRPDVVPALGPTNLPNFYRLRTEGAFTDNARADYDYTITLPNHATELTGRGILGTNGHNWADNDDPEPGQTLASNKGSYVAGVFDVVHDHGLRTGIYASKSKFSLFDTSWNATHGAPDVTGDNDGQDKIDVYVYSSDTEDLVDTLVENMSTQALHYVFLHLTDPDTIGHSEGWVVTNGSAYCDVMETMDARLGTIFRLITTNAALAGRTAILLTADHGGYLYSHSNASQPENYTVPFYVWGPGVMKAAPLYILNASNRLDPGDSRPTYAEPVQPVRNGEAANVCLQLLGLPAVPGSSINQAQDLALTVSPPAVVCLASAGAPACLTFMARSNVLYDVQARDDWNPGIWAPIATNIPGADSVVTNMDIEATTRTQRFYRLRLHF